MKNVNGTKKCWRERVTAEITVAHLVAFAREAGDEMSAAQAEAFLNEKGHAQEMWMQMMRAGEEFLKSHMTRRLPVRSLREADAVQMVN